MAKQKSKWRRRLIVLFASLVVVGVAGFAFLSSYATPTDRKDIATPLYTVGDENYANALAEGKNIVKFGRLPFGVYPGGVAFDNVDEASEHLKEIGKVESGWKVYVLSGDFELDTVQVGDARFTNKSLLVVREAVVIDERIELAYKEFDQTPDSGWRVLADKGEYEEAASLIEAYLAAHDELPTQQKRVLHFHAGQMHAYSDNYESAKSSFEMSLIEVEPEDSPIKWNAYVNATIAFLDSDEETLNACRKEISDGPKIGDLTPNLDVVDALITHLGQPYSVAYESHRGMERR